MPSDALGPESPLGDNADSANPQPEDFLGLEGPSEAVDLDALASLADAGSALPSPAVESQAPLEASLTPLTPRAKPWGDASQLNLSEEPDPLAEFLDDESQDFEFEGPEGIEGLEEEEESASWLMEFDPSDLPEESAEDFAEALYADDSGSGLGFEEAHSGRNPWMGRALIAMVSVFAGVLGSKLLSGPATTPQNNVSTRVAQVQPTSPSGSSLDPAGETMLQPNAPQQGNPGEQMSAGSNASAGSSTGSKPRGMATSRAGRRARVEKNAGASARDSSGGSRAAGGQASPLPTLPGAGAPATSPAAGAGQPAIAIDWLGPEPGSAGGPQELPIGEKPRLSPESKSGLRQASADELSHIWMGSSIPTDAIAGNRRILTPGVGRVRVVLASGEVFEGNLYAVGMRKVWLETQVGKMALLDYQIDRVEPIVGSDGDRLKGYDPSADLNGLQGVRVRTAGGVFYGKLISREGGTVVIVTESGGRITLQNAKVELAGKTATSLLDSSGATQRPKDQVATQDKP